MPDEEQKKPEEGQEAGAETSQAEFKRGAGGTAGGAAGQQPQEEEQEEEPALGGGWESFSDTDQTPAGAPAEEPQPERGPRDRVRHARRVRRHAPGVFWALLLIAAGVLLFLYNLGYLTPAFWERLVQLWPLLLIALGIDVLIGRRSALGAMISVLLIVALFVGAVLFALFAPGIPALAGWAQAPVWRVEHVEYPLAGIDRATVYIDWISVPGTLNALNDSPNLIEGNVAYRGKLDFQVQVQNNQADVRLDSTSSGFWFGVPGLSAAEGRWDVSLTPQVPVDLTMDAGSGSCNLDLGGLNVSELRLNVGSGAVELLLPSASDFQAQVNGGSGALSITVPAGVGARVDLTSGSGAFIAGQRFHLVSGQQRGSGVWESSNWNSAAHKIEMRIDQGSGEISIQ
jgi:hypothetical protein